MDSILARDMRELSIDFLLKTPIGEKLQKAADTVRKVQSELFALSEKMDTPRMTGVQAMTVTTFSILGKIAGGKMPAQLDRGDWMEIAETVSDQVVRAEGSAYAEFIFKKYEQYIRFCADQIGEIVPAETSDAISALADELADEAAKLQNGQITETTYIEDCLWISLEAMVKLLASTAALAGDNRITEFAEAAASYAFEYGRLMLYDRELVIINQFIENQHQLDEELAEQYADYLEALKKREEQFYILLNNAFASDFRKAFLSSAVFARSAGVSETEILSTDEDIDSFFLGS